MTGNNNIVVALYDQLITTKCYTKYLLQVAFYFIRFTKCGIYLSLSFLITFSNLYFYLFKIYLFKICEMFIRLKSVYKEIFIYGCLIN